MINVNSLAPSGQPMLQALFPRPLLGSTSGLHQLSSALSDLAKALQSLSDLLGGSHKAGGHKTAGAARQHSPYPALGKDSPVGVNPFLAPASQSAEKPIAGTARIWGDPHFIGADGDKFDVQGEPGKIYNLLSDRNFQLNGQFEAWGNGGATVVGTAAINADNNFITVNKSGEAFVNGLALQDGQKVDLFGGGTAEKKGDTVTVKKGEWEVAFQANGQYLNMDIKTENAVADGVKPQGLIGQTFDGDGKALMGDEGAGAQGGGAIKDANGNLSKAGDKNAVKSYEVDSLFSSIFRNHNASGFAPLLEARSGGQGQSSSADAEKMAQMHQAAMMGFVQLMMSLQPPLSMNWGMNRSY